MNRENTKKFMIAISSFLLIAIMVATIFLPFLLSRKGGESSVKNVPIPDLIPTEKHDYGISLLSAAVDAQANDYQSEYILTAVVEPENADCKNVAWTYAWQNPMSEWAKDKAVEDYFSVTFDKIADDGSTQSVDVSLSDGTYLVVKAKALVAFGEPVVVSVRSEEDQSKCAEQIFGYVKRIDLAQADQSRRRLKDGVPMGLRDKLFLGDNSTYSIEWTINLSAGTIAPTLSITSAYSTFLHTTSGISADDRWKIDLNDGYELNVTDTGYSLRYTFLSDNEFWKKHLKTDTLTDLRAQYDRTHGMLGYSVDFNFEISCPGVTNIYHPNDYFMGDFDYDISLLTIEVESVGLANGNELFYF